MAEPTQAEQKYREALEAIRAGKLIVINDGPRRDLVNGVRTSGEHRDGDRAYYADTLSGPFDLKTATFKAFENVRDAQHYLFEKREAVAA